MQQKMMLFTPAVGIIYGLWFFLAPNSYWSLMTVPADLITDIASVQLQNTKSSLILFPSSVAFMVPGKLLNTAFMTFV